MNTDSAGTRRPSSAATESPEAASDQQPSTSLPQWSEMERRDWLEVAAAILLSLATVGSAWAAYQATRWTGVQATAFGTASTLRAESVRAANQANALEQIDIAVLMQWVDATAQEDSELADFYRTRFRDEFRPAFQEWIASVGPGEVPSGTPFTLPEYRLAARTSADDLEARATASFEEAKEANQTGDNFVLTAVVMASVLFFAGIATRFRRPLRQVLLGLGLAMFSVGATTLVLLPQNVGF